MVEFITLLKCTFRKFQLQAEIAVLDHDATKRQKAFGVELYDLIERQQRVETKARIERTTIVEENNNNNNNNNEEEENEKRKAANAETIKTVEGFVLQVFRAIENNEIEEPLKNCRRDLSELKSLSVLPIASQRRKERFGIEIWPIVSQPEWLHESLGGEMTKALKEVVAKHTTNTSSSATDKTDNNNNNSNNDSNNDNRNTNAATTTTTAEEQGSGDGDGIKVLGGLVTAFARGVFRGTKTTIARAISRLSPEERAFEACVEEAKKDVALLEDKKTEKRMEIEGLMSDGTTLECC